MFANTDDASTRCKQNIGASLEEASQKMRRLWISVINQAFADATSESRKGRAMRFRIDAIKWLIQDNEDFETVCGLAGYNKSSVRDHAIGILINSPTRRRLTMNLLSDFHRDEMRSRRSLHSVTLH